MSSSNNTTGFVLYDKNNEFTNSANEIFFFFLNLQSEGVCHYKNENIYRLFITKKVSAYTSPTRL